MRSIKILTTFGLQMITDAQYTAVQLDCCHLLKVLSTVITKLKIIKGRTILQVYTDWVAIQGNESSWNGNYQMCTSFLSLRKP